MAVSRGAVNASSVSPLLEGGGSATELLLEQAITVRVESVLPKQGLCVGAFVYLRSMADDTSVIRLPRSAFNCSS